MSTKNHSTALRRNLIITLVGLQVITTVIILLFSRTSAETMLNQQTEQLLINAVKESAGHTNGFLTPAYRTTLSATELLSKGIINPNNDHVIEHYFITQLQQHSEFSSIYYSTTNGDFYFVSRNNTITDAEYLTKKINNSEEQKMTTLHWRDKHLNTVKETFSAEADFNALERPWYKETFKNQYLTWTQPYLFFTSQKIGITVSAPFYNTDGDILGVLGIDIELSSLSAFLETLNVGQSSSSFIVNQEGKFTASAIEARNSKKEERRASIQTLSKNSIEEKAVSLYFNSKDKKPTKTIKLRHNNTDYLVAFTPFRLSNNGPEWILATYISENAFLQKFKETEKHNIFIASIILFISIIIAWLLATRAWKPIDSWLNQAITDQLTGTFNRHYLFNIGSRMHKRALDSTQDELAIAIIDADYFKRINDEYGHTTGDKVLSLFAWRLQSELRPQDIIARFGGEEFVILFPDTDMETIKNILTRVQNSIKEKPLQTNNGLIKLTFSAGLNCTTIDSHTQFGDFIDAADKALFRAKALGRDKITIATVET